MGKWKQRLRLMETGMRTGTEVEMGIVAVICTAASVYKRSRPPAEGAVVFGHRSALVGGRRSRRPAAAAAPSRPKIDVPPPPPLPPPPSSRQPLSSRETAKPTSS